MSDEEKPDFSFLNELKSSSDSAILKKEESGSESEPETEPEKSETESEKQAESQPAWMDEPETLEDRYDSSTRFAAALGSPEDAESKSDGPFNFSDEQIVTQDQETEPANADSSNDEESSVEKEQAVSPEDTEAETAESEETKPTASTEQEQENVNESCDEEIEISEPVDPSEATATAEEAEPIKAAEKESEPQAPATKLVSTPTTATIKNPVQGPVVSKRKYIFVLSYASAITLVCAILIIQSFQAKSHDLESLPDLKPPMKDDEIAYRLVPEAAKLPLGHTLKLGQSRRFGNVLVTPTKVVYEPLKFAHYSQDPTKTRTVSKPVMKLWLKFENVSKDQKFAPLDRKLMLMRIVDSKQPEFMRSNQFLSPASSKGELDKTSLLYNLEMVGDWDFAGIEDDPIVPPGESLEIYLPSSEQAYDEMDGKITWRVQFRKGYHPQSKRGVTTLIEVVFDKKQIAST